MKMPIDVATFVSRELSTMIESITGDPDREETPTLSDVRTCLRRKAGSAELREELMHPQLCDSMLAEIDRLIDEFGDEAPASDFVANKASEALSRVIEVAMENPEIDYEPTLGGVRAAMTAGLTAIGVDPDVAVSGVLIYRLVSYYLPPLWGYVSLRWLTNHDYL